MLKGSLKVNEVKKLEAATDNRDICRVREVNPTCDCFCFYDNLTSFMVCWLTLKQVMDRNGSLCVWLMRDDQSSLMPDWLSVYLAWRETTTLLFHPPVLEELMESVDCCVVLMTNRRQGNQLVATAFNIPLKPGGDGEVGSSLPVA